MERDASILSVLPLANGMARRFYGLRTRLLDRDDLVQEARLAVVEAHGRFDPANTSRASFRTFAAHRIRGQLRDALRSADMLPRSARRLAGHTRSVLVQFDQETDDGDGESGKVFCSSIPSREISPETLAIVAQEISRKSNPKKALTVTAPDVTPMPKPSLPTVKPLTPQANKVVKMVVEGLSNADIAARLNIKENSVKKHLVSVFPRCGVKTRSQLVAWYHQNHSISPSSDVEIRLAKALRRVKELEVRSQLEARLEEALKQIGRLERQVKILRGML